MSGSGRSLVLEEARALVGERPDLEMVEPQARNPLSSSYRPNK
jgi:hypothetical protein